MQLFLFGTMGLVALIIHIVIYRNGQRKHPTPKLGLPNQITITRGILNSILAGFILIPPSPDTAVAWLPALIYIPSALLDILDGIVARRTNQHTKLGEYLDGEYDALGLLIVSALVVSMGQLPWWGLLFGLARYIFVLGQQVRTRNKLRVRPLTPSHNRRVAAGLMMAHLSVLVWPIVSPPHTTLAGIIFGLPFLIIFIRDWLVVSDTFSPITSHLYQDIRALGITITKRWLPLYSRLVTIYSILLPFILPALFTDQAPYDINGQPDLSTAFGWLGIIAAICVALAIIPRFTAVLLTIYAVFAPISTLASLALLAASLLLVSFGGGPYTLFTPEEQFFQRRIG